jgi:uncharacterized membrane protein
LFTSWFNQVHHFGVRQALYPMLLSTLLACSLLGGRVYLSGTWIYLFLVWNLFLAWIPYLLSLWISHLHQRRPQRWWYLLLPSLVWLAFFPNAPYIVTDFLHLHGRPSIPVWYDIGLLSVFAWTGLFLGTFSLRAMQSLVKTFVGSALSWVFVAGVVSLSGIGIYLGRFLRWNSWDLFLHPRGVLTDTIMQLTHPLRHPAPIGFTLLFAMFLLVCYLTIAVNLSPERS